MATYTIAATGDIPERICLGLPEIEILPNWMVKNLCRDPCGIPNEPFLK